MSSATLSILGLYKWGKYHDEDLFKNMILPDGVDRETLIDTILEQCAEFEIIYSNFEYLQYSIGTWSKRWNRTFTKWCEALQLKYNPIENYDRIEDWNESGKGKATSKDSADTVTDSFVTAYNSDKLHQERQDKASSSGNQETNSTDENERHGRIHGNIGVTTSQQMLESELKIAEFNLIQQITDIFKQEYCILVY